MEQHALEISELRLHIAAHLDLDSLKACVRVCHAWYNDLQSLVWARFNVDGCKLRESQRKQRASRLASLRKHSGFIKHIVRQGRRLTAVDRVEAYTILADQCRSLESIDMSLLDENEWELYRRLVRLNPGLCQVTISGIIQPVTATPIDYQPVSLVYGHPFLKQLAVDCPTTLSTILRVLEACPSIEQLVIGCDKKDVRSQLDPCDAGDCLETRMKEDLLCSDGLTPQTLPLFRLRQLKLEIPCNDPTLVKLLERCPALEQLSLSPLSTQVLTSMCQLLADHRLPCLTSLTLRRFEQMETQVAILKATPSHQLRELALFPVVDAPDIDDHDSESHEGGGHGDDDVVRVLISHQHQSLEHLYLVLKDTRPNTLRDIFLTCGHLKRLNLKMQHAVDIRHLIDQPWACTELEELTMKVAQDRRRPNSSGSSNRQDSTMSIDIAAIEQELGEDAMTQSTTPSRKEWERVEAIFMRRIGTLTRLQVLDLKGSRQAGSNITFSLANGLGHLATLEQLQEIVISDRGRHQDIAELQFMKEHWPRLKKLTFYATRPTDRWLKLRWPQLKVVDLSL